MSAVLVTAALLAGCALSPPAGGEGSSPYAPRVVQVVAAEDFWGSIAAQLGGAHAHVVSIITSPETDPHAYEPTAADARRLADAQVAVLNGAGYDPWMQQLLSADGGSRTVLDVGTLVGVAPGGNPHLRIRRRSSSGYVGAVTADLGRRRPGRPGLFRRPGAALRAGRTIRLPRRARPPSGSGSPGPRWAPPSRSWSTCVGPSDSTW